jgi:mevalonate kinase
MINSLRQSKKKQWIHEYKRLKQKSKESEKEIERIMRKVGQISNSIYDYGALIRKREFKASLQWPRKIEKLSDYMNVVHDALETLNHSKTSEKDDILARSRCERCIKMYEKEFDALKNELDRVEKDLEHQFHQIYRDLLQVHRIITT